MEKTVKKLQTISGGKKKRGEEGREGERRKRGGKRKPHVITNYSKPRF
jgi:hypothetical protein